jgi:c(7)-type cytochrome triheme protein
MTMTTNTNPTNITAATISAGGLVRRAALLLCFATASAAAADLPNGKAIYDATCGACHNSGVAGAPKLGDVAAWAPRIKTGPAALYASAGRGMGALPARGGNASLSDAQLHAAVNYIIGKAGAGAGAGPKTAVPKVAAAVPSPTVPVAAAKAVAPAKGAAPAAPAAKASEPVAAPAVAVAPATGAPVPSAPAPTSSTPAAPVVAGGVNPFNRLMPTQAQRNLPPPQDGIHDASNDGTMALQAPLAAFAPLAKSNDGNRVDWVKSLKDGNIKPRVDRNDPNATPMVMDLNIVREVKGSMPDVVYPHKQHTEWLDCSNCHPAIFIPQKGANQISMAGILMGEKCGVCHGKVAFPVSECRRCHSKSKPATAVTAAKP